MRHKRNPGIYKITNIRNGHCYIGSSISVEERVKEHFNDLKLQKHHSRYFQRAYNKYGQQSFVLDILELVTENSQLEVREQYWLDLLKPEYNIRIFATNNNGIKRTDEFKEKVRNNLLGRKHSEETKAKISRAVSGSNNDNYGTTASREQREKQSNLMKGNKYSMTKTYPGLVSPDGKIFAPITNLASFCREHSTDNYKLDQSALTYVMRGKYNSHHGWRKYAGYSQ